MKLVSDQLQTELLSPNDGPVATVLNPNFMSPVLLVCEHASASIPEALGDLGLSVADRFSHAVWDPGAGALTEALSSTLNAPAILSRVSRLVYDCNRPPERPDAMPDQTEKVTIPGNRDLSDAARALRTTSIYDPFHALVGATIDQFEKPPALVTVHSFSPIWFDKPRSTEIGILHDDDPTLALEMMALAEPGIRIELNEPYSAKDGVTHTLARHGSARGLRNVMLEIRNDLLATDEDVGRISAVLTAMLAPILAKEGAQT